VTELPSERAMAIARGLIRSGRASGVKTHSGYLRLPTENHSFYWISVDGDRLFRGERRESAIELQRGFIDAMMRAGEERIDSGRAISSDPVSERRGGSRDRH
jgi:hypothetical protein